MQVKLNKEDEGNIYLGWCVATGENDLARVTWTASGDRLVVDAFRKSDGKRMSLSVKYVDLGAKLLEAMDRDERD